MPNDRVRVAYDRDFPPFSFEAGGDATGLAVEIIRAVLARAGIAPEFVPVPHAAQDAALAAGEVDAIAFKGATAARRADFDLSAPLFFSGGAWFVPSHRPVSGDRPQSGARVATPAKGPLGAEIAALFPDLAVLKVETYSDALRAALDGTADLAALGFQVGVALARRDFDGQFRLPDAPFKPILMALACVKDRNRPFLAEFDRELAELTRDGIIPAIEARWMAT